MNAELKEKLNSLPHLPGVYFHKSKSGEVIYVGKAAVLKSRVKSYFQNLPAHDIKTQALIAEISDVSWTETDSEIDALFLESEMVKRYKPRYNVLLRDDKSQLFVRINMKDKLPYVSTTRQPADDGSQYYGPYFNGWAVTKALRHLRKVFPFYTKPPNKKEGLDFHLGLSPGVLSGAMTAADYKKSLSQLAWYLKGQRKKIQQQLSKRMKHYAKNNQFEKAAAIRNKLHYLSELQRQIVFGREEFLDLSKDQALVELASMLCLLGLPKRIEGYDISHMSGTNNAASMVVATNGLADKKEYRKFKLRTPGNDDFGHMTETLNRRFSGRHLEWQLPDLILIDGGKGQLSAAAAVLKEKKLNIPMIGLAKRQEEIVIHEHLSNLKLDAPKHMVLKSGDFLVVRLPQNSHIIKLLQRIRDESHRFAVSYHTSLKRHNQTTSQLEGIAGIGPATRKKLLREFGSLRGIRAASQEEIRGIVGSSKAKAIRAYLSSTA